MTDNQSNTALKITFMKFTLIQLELLNTRIYEYEYILVCTSIFKHIHMHSQVVYSEVSRYRDKYKRL